MPDATLYRDSMMAHSAIGQVFDIPVVMTTSAQSGPYLLLSTCCAQ